VDYENDESGYIYASSDLQNLAQFFNGIGVLVKRKLIDIALVEDLLSNRVIWWWEMYRARVYHLFQSKEEILEQCPVSKK
jgi:hypothetical protein